jgi:hypothetical protein
VADAWQRSKGHIGHPKQANGRKNPLSSDICIEIADANVASGLFDLFHSKEKQMNTVRKLMDSVAQAANDEYGYGKDEAVRFSDDVFADDDLLDMEEPYFSGELTDIGA